MSFYHDDFKLFDMNLLFPIFCLFFVSICFWVMVKSSRINHFCFQYKIGIIIVLRVLSSRAMSHLLLGVTFYHNNQQNEWMNEINWMFAILTLCDIPWQSAQLSESPRVVLPLYFCACFLCEFLFFIEFGHYYSMIYGQSLISMNVYQEKPLFPHLISHWNWIIPLYVPYFYYLSFCHFALKFNFARVLCCWFDDAKHSLRKSIPRSIYNFYHFPPIISIFWWDAVFDSNSHLDFYCIFYAVSHWIACSWVDSVEEKSTWAAIPI